MGLIYLFLFKTGHYGHKRCYIYVIATLLNLINISTREGFLTFPTSKIKSLVNMDNFSLWGPFSFTFSPSSLAIIYRTLSNKSGESTGLLFHILRSLAVGLL